MTAWRGVGTFLMPAAKPSIRKSTSKGATGFRRLPLAWLRVFVAAADHLSFTQAADVLGVSTAAVSMQIRALEEYLRSRLFRRRGSLVQLTAEGAQLLPRVRRGLEELERAINEARLERRTGPVTMSMLASFLQQWLLPRLPAFYQRHPEIDLRIHTSSTPVDFVRSDVQVAIRFGLGKGPQLHAQKLLDDWVVPVCTPQLLAKHGPVNTRQDLERYRLLHSKSEPWRGWPGGAVEEEIFMGDEWGPRGATFDDSVTVVHAAEAGQGLALARWSLVSREIEAARLAIASRRIMPMKRAYFFVCPIGYVNVDKVAALRSWMLEEAERAPRPPINL